MSQAGGAGGGGGGGGLSWKVVTSADNTVQISKNHGYICDGVPDVVLLLPLVTAVGDEFAVLSHTSKFQITQNAGEQMRVGTASSTVGATGKAVSNAAGDYVEFVCVGSNLFVATSVQGTITLS